MNKLHIEQLAGAEKALREIHAEYGKLKEKADRYHGIIRTKNLANSDVLQQRVEELTLQLKEKEQNEMLMEGQIEELEDEVRILKAQLSGTDVNLGPRTSKKVSFN
jgi:chromosome segregation ATPase